MFLIEKNVNSKKLKENINSLLKNDIYKNRNIECCSSCGGKKYIKYGSYKGIQRYKCKECRKTFSNTTNSLLSYSKKDINIWIEFVELMIQKKSLRFCAKKLKISITTAFYILFYLDKVFNYIDIISYLSLSKRFIRTKEIGVYNIK